VLTPSARAVCVCAAELLAGVEELVVHVDAIPRICWVANAADCGAPGAGQ